MPEGHRLKAGSLGPVGIAFFVLAAAAPMAAFVGAGPTTFSMIGPGVPLVYLVIAAVVALFSVGYLRMSRYVTSAAGFVAYIGRGLGTRAAGASAGIVIVTYIALQLGFWAQFGVFANQALVTYGGIDIPPWAWAFVFIAVTTVLSMYGVDMSLRVLGVILSLEVVVVVILLVGILVHGVESPSFESFSPSVFSSPGLGLAFLFVAGCFTTFEATTVFSEEARDPARSIPVALYTVIGFIAVFYGVASWIVSMALGPDNVQEAAAGNLSGIMFQLARDNVGPWLEASMQIMVVTSYLAMLLGMSNMFARYTFALSRAGILPKGLAVIGVRHTPARASLVNGVVVAVLLAVFFACGADPMVNIFAWSVALGTVGFLLIMAVSVAVLAFFLRRAGRGSRRGVGALFATVIAPGASVILLVGMLVFSIGNYDAMLLGDGGTAKLLLIALPFAALLGAAAAHPSRNVSFTVNNTEKSFS